MGSYKTLEKKGLTVVAMHRGEGTEAEIAWTAASKKWPFPVYNNGTVKDFTLGGNPQAFVFDGSGKAVCVPGDGGDFNKVMTAKVNEAPDWVLGAGTFTKMAAQAKDVAARKNLGKILAEATEKSNSADEAEKGEAARMAECLKRYAEALKARADRWVEDGRPSEALEVWKALAEQFKDSDLGKEAADEAAKAKADESFKKELEAEKLWKGVEPAYYKIAPPKKGDDVEKWKAKNAGALKPVREKLKALAAKFGETRVCQVRTKRAEWVGLE